MPSIDLVRLRTQARELAERIDDPGQFQAGLRALMEANAHRLLRRGLSMARRSALPAWEVPAIFLRELETHLRPAALADPQAALLSAMAVWNGGRLEEKIVASRLAALTPEIAVLETTLQEWLPGVEDPVLLEELARQFGARFTQGDPTFLRALLRKWLENAQKPMRRFAWMMLMVWLREDAANGTLSALDLLPSAFPETDPEASDLALRCLSITASLAPSETIHWLSNLPSPAFRQGSFLRKATSRLPPETGTVLAARVADT